MLPFYPDRSGGWENPLTRRERREEMLDRLADLEHERLSLAKDAEVRKKKLKLQRTQSLPPMPHSSFSEVLPTRRLKSMMKRDSKDELDDDENDEEDENEKEKKENEAGMEDSYEKRSDLSRFVGARGNAGLIFETRYSYNAPGLDVTELYPHLREAAAQAAQAAQAAAAAAAASEAVATPNQSSSSTSSSSSSSSSSIPISSSTSPSPNSAPMPSAESAAFQQSATGTSTSASTAAMLSPSSSSNSSQTEKERAIV